MRECVLHFSFSRLSLVPTIFRVGTHSARRGFTRLAETIMVQQSGGIHTLTHTRSPHTQHPDTSHTRSRRRRLRVRSALAFGAQVRHARRVAIVTAGTCRPCRVWCARGCGTRRASQPHLVTSPLSYFRCALRSSSSLVRRPCSLMRSARKMREYHPHSRLDCRLLLSARARIIFNNDVRSHMFVICSPLRVCVSRSIAP